MILKKQNISIEKRDLTRLDASPAPKVISYEKYFIENRANSSDSSTELSLSQNQWKKQA